MTDTQTTGQPVPQIMPAPITDPRLSALGATHGSTFYAHGDMKTAAARKSFFTRLGIAPARIMLLHQIHSADALEVLRADDVARYGFRPRPNADGWILGGGLRGIGAAVYSADCAPVFLWDKKAASVAILHCGWRGTVAGFAGKAARRMTELGAAGPLNAFIAPHIGACCFEVGPEVACQFNPACVTRKNGRDYADITLELTLQLQAAGLNRADIRSAPQCTRCSGETYHSFRRTGRTSAMLSYILL
ncbi:MAG: polyphenol oxidase family protein [Elusimicrobiaceae bacterium]|nr:polyphenol oxidase family protein [Elusimicrobiaceae bacterium]